MNNSFADKNIFFLMSFGHCGIDWVHSLVDNHPQILITPGISPYRSWKVLQADKIRSVQDMYEAWMALLGEFLDRGISFLSTEEEWNTFRRRFYLCLERDGINRVSVIGSIYEAYAYAKKIEINNIKAIIIHEHVCFPIHQVLSDFKQANILMILRDPRAAIAGYFKGITKKFSDRPDYYDHYFNLSFEEWMQATDIVKKYERHLGRRLKIVKNEELHQNLEMEMRNIAGWMGVEFATTMMMSKNPDGTLQTPDSCYISRNGEYAEPKESFFDSESVKRRWMLELADAREILMIETLFSDLMQRYSYQRLTKKSLLSKIRGVFYFLCPHRGPKRLNYHKIDANELRRSRNRIAKKYGNLSAMLWDVLPSAVKKTRILLSSVIWRSKTLLFKGNRWKRYDIPHLYI